jgi:spermidine synthase
MSQRSHKIIALLFGSGFCALIYQIAWQRELRLIFGGSTAASAAVVSVFIGGLGLGSLLLGKRVDRHANPLAYYARLEILIGLSTATTPGLLWLCRKIYIAMGGTIALGSGGASTVRLLLSAVVLGVPTVLMGGTLPAASRAIETHADKRRRGVAWLYGLNTLGAVTGCTAATFVLLEVFGTRLSLWIACLLNLLVGIFAFRMSRSAQNDEGPRESATAPEPAAASAAPTWFVLACCAVVGFAFFLMELVWYRMLGPILGGSVFTFGLILSVALLGIGLGSACYALLGNDRPATVAAFSLTCLAEAACIALPYALGDRIAVLAIAVRPLGVLGFPGLMVGWGVVAAIVVVPAAFAAGVQFPILIGLLGRGRAAVARHVGWAYASNTVGAVVGALAGGFGLIPALTAPGCWRLVCLVLLATGAAAIALSLRKDRRPIVIAAALLLGASAGWMLSALGPTAAWRHSPIGAGRVNLDRVSSTNAIRRFLNGQRSDLVWEREGVESSVAVIKGNSLAFVVNGKVDGNARHDAPTQVMAGLLGALLRPNPRKAMVIGLGTGSSAGWLGAVESIERVDVAELEPAIVEVARECTAVNHDVLSNPKVRVLIGDARELLQTAPDRYDIIFSEPSNPYRAGIASLFTEQYYRSALSRLEPHGLFLQWVQAYEVDARTVRTIYATLGTVFPFVETWQLRRDDLLLVASLEHPPIDMAGLRGRVRQEPFLSALRNAWRVDDAEGVLGHYIAGPLLAQQIVQSMGGFINTDDQTLVEFGFARALGEQSSFSFRQALKAARDLKQDLPEVVGEVDWSRVEEGRATVSALEGARPEAAANLNEQARHRVAAQAFYAEDKLQKACSEWALQPRPPSRPFELIMIADCLASRGDAQAETLAEQIKAFNPANALALLAALRSAQDREEDAVRLTESALVELRRDPWGFDPPARRTLALAQRLASRDPDTARRMADALHKPFALYALETARREAITNVLRYLDFKSSCVDIVSLAEPHVPWTEDMLVLRRDCYRVTGDGRLQRAEQQLAELLQNEPPGFIAAQ